MVFKLPGLSLGSSKSAANPNTVDVPLQASDENAAKAALPFLAGKTSAEQLRLLRVPFMVFAALTAGFVLYLFQIKD